MFYGGPRVLSVAAAALLIILSTICYREGSAVLKFPGAVDDIAVASRVNPDNGAPRFSIASEPVPSGERSSRGKNPAAPAEFYRIFVTPGDPAVLALADHAGGWAGAYQAALQWVYVSDEKLHRAVDRWLTPREFLMSAPQYPDNPVPGQPAGDCEEKANTLVSVIRAQGVSPEEVRVCLGEVAFGAGTMGHAWVELLREGRWMVLDPCSGTYWDDGIQKLNKRPGVPYDYYSRRPYPAIRVWTYYNDVYCLEAGGGSGEVPPSWAAPPSAPGR